MEKCLICNIEFKNNRALGCHIKRTHKITANEYKIKFDLLKKCKKCGLKISRNSKSGFCIKCRDYNGKNNPFYGKKHSNNAINVLKEKCSVASKEKWTDIEYRNKVIKNSSKKRSLSGAINISTAVKKWYKDNPCQIEKRKIYMKKYWDSGIIISNNFSCNKSKLEDELYEILKQYYPTIKKNVTLRSINGKWYFPDIVFEECKLIIEFYGDYWHANPKFYNENDILKQNLTSKEIWEKDKNRINELKNNIINSKYDVIIVWQNDFIENKNSTLQNIHKYINDRLHTIEI